MLNIQGCYTADGIKTYEAKKIVSAKSNINKSFLNSKKDKPVIKKPKYAPYDWTEKDASSRKIWFEDNGTVYSYCKNLTGIYHKVYKWYDINSRKIKIREDYVLPKDYVPIKKTFLRNGNYIHKFYVANSVKEILKIEASPKDTLVKIQGIQGLKPKKSIIFEVKENIRSLRFKFVEESNGKRYLKECKIDFYDSRKLIRTKAEFEKARGDAIKRLASEEKIAPILQEEDKEKNRPVISINDIPKSTDSLNFFLRGIVKDDSGIATVLVKKQKAKVSADGRFVHRLKLGYGTNKIKIQAEDINGNVSEKVITIVREEYISEQTLVDVDLPPKTKMNNPNGIAVVIGIENYQYVPDATYAYNDAEVFREYLSETLGFKKQKIKIATNSKATQAELNKLLSSNGWLSRNVIKDKSDIVVYFSGHGIANPKDQSTGLLPFDVDPNYSVGLPLKKLYSDLSKLGARSITIFLDACFTGQSRDAKMLIADARPIIILPKKNQIPENINILSAASNSQISGAIREKEHGLFTYYLLRGLSGDADLNKDSAIKLKELSNYVSMNVKEQAALNGREQIPQLKSIKDKLLVKFN